MLSGACSSPWMAVARPSRAKTLESVAVMSRLRGVAELVKLGGAVGFYAGGLVAGVVAAEVGFAEWAEEFAEGFVAEEVHALVGDLEAGFAVAVALLALAFCGLLGVDEVLLLHLLDDLVDEFFDLIFGEGFVFFLGFFVEEFAGVERLLDGLAKVLHGLVAIELLEAGHGIVEAESSKKSDRACMRSSRPKEEERSPVNFVYRTRFIVFA